jgi:hypothetical protein
MCLRFVFLLITRVITWLRLARCEEAWKTSEILILRHQLSVMQREQPHRPKLNWADRALLAALLSVIPKARRQGLRLLVTRRRSCGGTAISSAAAPLKPLPQPVDLDQYRMRKRACVGGTINEYRLVV